jgi:DNA end-binding protein Ku
MAKALWKGHISFGLVTIPVVLYPAETHTDIHFHLVDSRNLGRIRYERINAETGKEVPWSAVAKAYEVEKDNMVLIKEEELDKLKEKNLQVITIEDFVDDNTIDSVYFDKPYFIVPDKKGEKGYVLLRETLKATKTIGIAKLPIRTRQYLAALMPYHNALVVNTLRYADELRQLDELDLPTQELTATKITPKEMNIAKQLVNSMKTAWEPSRYHDTYQAALAQWLEEKAQEQAHQAKRKGKKGGTITPSPTNVLDFMTLLKKSLATKPSKKTKKVSHKTAHKH